LNKDPKLMHSIVSKFRSEGANLGKILRALTRSRPHAVKLNERLACLQQGKCPLGTRPSKLPFESAHWKHAVSDSISHQYPALKDCKCLEEARLAIQLQSMAVCTVLDLEVEQLRIKELESQGSLESFVARCRSISDQYTSSFDATVTGLKLPPGLFSPLDEQVKAEAARVYRLQVESASRKAWAFTEQQDKQKERSAKILSEAAKLTPTEVLGRAFSSFVKKNKNKNRKNPTDDIDYLAMLAVPVNAPTLVEPKNGLSPEAARGHSSSPQTSRQNHGKEQGERTAKGKAKGKGNGQPQPGKGKGKGQPQHSGKGPTKGKGKGKGNMKGSSSSAAAGKKPNRRNKKK
jgi:hypothetical protein